MQKRSKTCRYVLVHVRTHPNHGWRPGEGLGVWVCVGTGGSMSAHMDTHRDGARVHRRVCRGGLDIWKRSKMCRYASVHVRTHPNHGWRPGEGLGMWVCIGTGGSMLAHMDTHRDGARAHRRACRLCRGGLDAQKRSKTHRYMSVHVRTHPNHGWGPGEGLGTLVHVSTGGSILAFAITHADFVP